MNDSQSRRNPSNPISLDADSFDTFNTAVVLSDLNLIIADLEAMLPAIAHAAAFVTETLNPGVYTTGAAAATITGALTLDGLGVPGATFVIKSGAAITPAAGAVINLTGGTLPENVHFLAAGAIAVGAGSAIKGNLICKAGAPSLGAGCAMVGRLLTLNGAVSLDGSSLTLPTGSSSTIDYRSVEEMVMFTGLTTVANTGASNITGNIASNSGAVSGFGAPAVLIGTIYPNGISTPNQNNYLPVETGGNVVFENNVAVYVFPTANVVVTGFDGTGFEDNEGFPFTNLGTADVTIEPLSPDSIDANKVAIDTPIVLKPYQNVYLYRRNTGVNRWLAKINN
jgi:hypothetical protein